MGAADATTWTRATGAAQAAVAVAARRARARAAGSSGSAPTCADPSAVPDPEAALRRLTERSAGFERLLASTGRLGERWETADVVIEGDTSCSGAFASRSST